jgi:hypothetical protein
MTLAGSRIDEQHAAPPMRRASGGNGVQEVATAGHAPREPAAQ